MAAESRTQRSQDTPLKRAIRDSGLRQNWIAERCGIDVSTMSRYVNGLHAPDDKRLLIAETLGRTVDEVFGNGEAEQVA